MAGQCGKLVVAYSMDEASCGGVKIAIMLQGKDRFEHDCEVKASL